MKLTVQLIQLESFELIEIYLKRLKEVHSKRLKEMDYTIYMNMNDNDYITILPKRGLKRSSYKMNMNKKDLKRLSKSLLIKLLIKQEKMDKLTSLKTL